MCIYITGLFLNTCEHVQCTIIFANIHTCSIVYLCLPTVQAAHIQEYMFIACAGLANVPVHVHCMYMYMYMYDLGDWVLLASAATEG